MSTIPLGPVIDTSTAPTSGARVVEPQLPQLLFTNTHHLCPGCGEPLAIRALAEAIEDLDLVHTAICALGIPFALSVARRGAAGIAQPAG